MDYIVVRDGEVIYRLKQAYHFRLSKNSKNQKLGELGRAAAIKFLVEQWGIPPSKINLEAPVVIGTVKRSDAIIELGYSVNNRKAVAIVEVKTTIHPDKLNYYSFIKNQLYHIANVYERDKKLSYPAILIGIVIDANDLHVVEAKWFDYEELVNAERTWQLEETDIFNNNSPFAQTSKPVVMESKIYFKARPLTYDDLLEISDVNRLKKFLKEDIHQFLRKFGIIEDDAFEFISKILLAKTYDEIVKQNSKEYLQFQIYPNDTPRQVYDRIETLMRDAYSYLLGEDARSAEKHRLLSHDQKYVIVFEVVKFFQRVKLRSKSIIGDDYLGDVFLDFMHSLARQSKGMFFTHPIIARFVVKAIGINKNQVIMDPSCGSGTFLIEALRLMTTDEPNIQNIPLLARKTLFGLDIDNRAITLCKINMAMHGDGSANVFERDAIGPLSTLPFSFTKQDNIATTNSPTKEYLKEGIDVIVTNPPFSIALRQKQVDRFIITKYLPFKQGITLGSEFVFAERWFQLLRPGGKLAAVLPISVLDGLEYAKARRVLLSFFKPIAIIGLPEYAFAPHAQQKTILFFAIRRTNEEATKLLNLIEDETTFFEAIGNEQVLVLDAKAIGYIRYKKAKAIQTKLIDANDLTDELAQEINLAFNNQSHKAIPLKLLVIDGRVSLQPRKTNSGRKIGDEWFLAKVDKTDKMTDTDLFCETGDIASRIGVLIPKHLNQLQEKDKIRIRQKIKSFGKLKAGDVIIAPVRPYLAKIAVITPFAEKHVFFSDQFIVLRRKQPDMDASWKLAKYLIDHADMLMSITTTGKAGYPRIQPQLLLQLPLEGSEIKNLTETIDSLYEVMLNQK